MKTKSNVLSALILEAMEAKTMYEITESMRMGWEGFEKDTASIQEVIDAGHRFRNALSAIESMIDYLDDCDIDSLIDLEDLGFIH